MGADVRVRQESASSQIFADRFSNGILKPGSTLSRIWSEGVMSEMFTQAQVIAAVITGIVTALITTPVTAWVARITVKEAQLREIVAERMKAYPKLWSVIQKNTSDRIREGIPPTANWAVAFLHDLDICHAEVGVFLSQDIYARFCILRKALVEIAGRAKKDEPISQGDMERLDRIWSGRSTATVPDEPTDNLGLATLLKDELASYEILGFSKRRRFSFWTNTR
jgi:hypothetical protein